MVSKVILICCAVLPVSCWAQETKPVKPTAPVVLGTKQLAGDFGKIGTTYTIGKQLPLNLTIQKVEYSIVRLTQQEVSGMSEPYFHGGTYTINVIPKSDSQLLILHGTIQNPNPKEVPLNIASFTWTAVAKDDRNFGACGVFSVEGSKKYLDTTLKPAQKISFYIALLVPGGAEIPKLIVARQNEAQPVIRYNLAGIGNAAAVDSKDTLTGVRDTYIQTEFIDWKVTGPVEFKDSAIGEYMLEDGKKWVILPVTFKGSWAKPAGGEPTVGMGTLDAVLKTEDGENITPYIFARPGGYQDHFLFGKRDGIYTGSPDDGQEVPARIAFQMSKDAKLSSIVIKQKDLRTIKFAADQLIAK